MNQILFFLFFAMNITAAIPHMIPPIIKPEAAALTVKISIGKLESFESSTIGLNEITIV